MNALFPNIHFIFKYETTETKNGMFLLLLLLCTKIIFMIFKIFFRNNTKTLPNNENHLFQMLALRRLMQGDAKHPKAPLGNNFRPPQPLHHRPVRTNIDFNVKHPADVSS